jgi:hypothetical protein
VDATDPAAQKPFGRAQLPLAVTRSANYGWLYATACVSPTLTATKASLDGKVLDASGKVRKVAATVREGQDESGFRLWKGSWELFDLPPGTYTLELTAVDGQGRAVCSRSVPFSHGAAVPGGQK